MRKKGLGFICIGPDDRFYFFNKDTKIIESAKINRGEYLPKRIPRLKKRFPLNQTAREELIIKIMEEYKLLTQKT